MAITVNEQKRIFYLDGKNTTYAFMINEYNYAEHLYYGKSIGHDDITYIRGDSGGSMLAQAPTYKAKKGIYPSYDSYHQFPAEISFYGTGDYREPALEITHQDGSRIVELLYDSYEIVGEKQKPEGMPAMRGGETLVLHLKDTVSHFGCDLYYTVYDDVDVIARRIVYKNEGESDVSLNRAYSFTFHVPDMDYDVMTLYGAWGRERRIEAVPAHHGVISVDSKRTSSSATLNPFMALVKKGACEEYGDIYGFSLVYSSSFVLKAEGVNGGSIQVTGGINDFDFSWKLQKGEKLETPEIVIAYSCEGLGGMSRIYHDAYREYLINRRFVKEKRPLVINNWEGTYFDFDNKKLKEIAKAVQGTGIDTFVLDDGWFGKRDDDFSGLGDWFVNTDKLEGGLTEIIEYISEMGMKFGLWFEPEMVNADSNLYREHPDYAIGVPGRVKCQSRNQYMLDLTRKEVRDYIVDAVNKVLHEHNISYVKWDYNRNVTDAWSYGLAKDRQAEFSHRYALGLYDLCERIVEGNPEVFFEGCSSGGGRFDPAILYYFPQVWTSDNTDAEDRTLIQYGTSMMYPLSTMSCHVSVVPNHQTGRITRMDTRADIAHLGATGYELDTTAFSDEDRECVRRQIEEYHEIEELVLDGDLYRTENPMESNYFGFMLVSKDKKEAFLTAYRRLGHANGEVKRLKVCGLDKDIYYYVKELDSTFLGATLMNVGLLPVFDKGDFKTVKYHFMSLDI